MVPRARRKYSPRQTAHQMQVVALYTMGSMPRHLPKMAKVLGGNPGKDGIACASRREYVQQRGSSRSPFCRRRYR